MHHLFKTRRVSFILALLLGVFATKPSFAADNNNNMMNLAIWAAVGSLGFACYQGKAPCSLRPGIDGDKQVVSFDTGSDHSIKQNRIAWGADWKDPLFENDDFRIDGRWEINANEWHSTLAHPKNKSGWIVGLTPVFHYNWKLSGFTPYLEAGAGPQFLSNITIENTYKSTQFQFGDILGFGMTTKHFELGYRFLHISNANIEIPNPGTNFHNLHIAYKF